MVQKDFDQFDAPKNVIAVGFPWQQHLSAPMVCYIPVISNVILRLIGGSDPTHSGQNKKNSSNNNIGLDWTFDKWAHKGMCAVFLSVGTEG